MKKFKLSHLFVGIALASSSAVTHAAVNFPLDYNTFFAASAINSGGTSLETGNTAAVGTWVVGTAGTNAVSPLVSDNNLSYGSYTDNNSGKKIALASLVTGSTARTSTFYITNAATDLTSGPYYMSFLLNVSAASTGVNMISFGNSSTGGSLRGRVYIKGVTGGYVLGATIDGSPLNYDSKDTLKLGVTNLIVLKQKIDLASATAGSATTSIFVNPTLGSSEPATASATTSETAAVTGLDCIKSIAVVQNVGVAAEIGGIRLSNTWEDVTKIAGGPKLTTPTVAATSSINATGFTVNWTPVANALSYDVKVYQNGGLVKTTNVLGQSSSSATITGLSNLLIYTYTVTAVGDVTNHSNSDASAVQKVIMPLNYTTFFATSAVASGETSLETGNVTAAVSSWNLAGTANGANPAISASDLSFSDYIDNNTSKKISLLSDVAAQRTSLFYLTSSATDLTAGTYYLGFLLKVNTPPATSGSTLVSFTNSNTGGQRGRLNIMGFGAGYQLAASLTGSSIYYSSTLAFGTTYLVIMKHEITLASATAGEATNSIFINPVLGAGEPVANASKSETGITSLDCIKGIAINQQPGMAAEIAGLRFGTTWDEVTKTSIPNAISNPVSANIRIATLSASNWLLDLSAVSGLAQLNVVNMQGQTVLKRMVTGGASQLINTNLTKGIYIVTLKAANRTWQTKVMAF